MKKLLIALLLFIPALSLAAGIAFIQKATIEGEDIVRSGTMYGLDVGPTGGRYEVFITNARSFKGDVFTEMHCTVHNELATPMAVKFKSTIVMTTTYYEKDGSITEAIGYIAGMTVLPADNYVVIVKNKAKNGVWNLFKCRIK